MADNLTTATINVRGNTRALEKDIMKALQTVELSQINSKKSSQALGRITGQVSEFNKSLEASNARVIAFGASAGAIFAVEKAFSSLISSTVEVEKKLTDINVLLNASSSGLQKFGDSLFSVAKNTAQSFSTVADAATELARQGLGVEETLKRTNAALILTRLSGLDAKSSVEALTATLNSFSGSALDAVEVVNKLANVDAAFAVSSADLANAISRVGSTAVDAGVSLDELIALVTSAQQTTARGGAVIGNSFKTIFTRLQRGKVQDLLTSLGIDVTEGQSAISLLKQLATVYDTLGAAQKSNVAEQVGGVFQINILKAALADLGKEYSIYGRALDTSLSSTDQAIRRNELLNKSVSALSSQALTGLQQAASKIGAIVFEPNAKGMLSGFNTLLDSFNNIDTESVGGKLMTGLFKGVGDFIGGPGAIMATAVMVKLFSKLAQFAAGSAKELLGTSKAAQQQAAIEQSILGILQKNSQFTSQILSGKMTTVQAEKELLNYLTAQSNVLREQERLSKVIGTNLRASGVSIGASGMPMTAKSGKKAAASGYIPNFASEQVIGQAMENSGARQHGYKAGRATQTTIHDGNGKSFKSFVNSKEDIKTFTNAGGKKATIVRPPNGFGKNTQYASGGYIPNFANTSNSTTTVGSIASVNPRVKKNLKGNLEENDTLTTGPVKSFHYNSPLKNASGKQYEKYALGFLNEQTGPGWRPSGSSLRYGPTSAVDAYRINRGAIDLAEFKSGAVFDDLILNKMLRGLPENYGTGNLLDVAFREGNPDEGVIDRVKFNGYLVQATQEAKSDISSKYSPDRVKMQKNQEAQSKEAFFRSGSILSRAKSMSTSSASGFIPNFASGIITGDVLRGNEYKAALDLVANSNKPVRTILGPSGIGKTTMASGSGGSIVKSFQDLANYDSYILDRADLGFPKDKSVEANLKKIFEKSQSSGSLDVLFGSRSTVRSLREKRAEQGDKIVPDRAQLQTGSGGVSSFVKKIRGFKEQYPDSNFLRMRKSKGGYQLENSNFADGFIPNFAGGKMQDRYKKTQGISSMLSRGEVAKRTANKGLEEKNLGRVPITMIHGGSDGAYSIESSYTGRNKQTGKDTKYTGNITSAGLSTSRLKGKEIQQRVGDALVGSANDITKVFNPSAGGYSSASQLANSGAVGAAAGTVFESALRKAFDGPAKTETGRIDFPNPSSQLQAFFNNAPVPYEAKITDTPGHRSETLGKYIAVNGLSAGYVPNFKSGISFSQSKEDEFGIRALYAKMGGKNVGRLETSENKDGVIDIGDISVNKANRGRGISSELYKEAIKRSAGKKMKGQLLPQMNRLLEKIKKGEPVSAETLFPQIKRADLAKDSVFEVYGHKGNEVEKMTRDQFSSLVNGKINELKKDPKRLQSYFGNIEADDYGGLGIGLTTQHSSGFVPNFAKQKLADSPAFTNFYTDPAKPGVLEVGSIQNFEGPEQAAVIEKYLKNKIAQLGIKQIDGGSTNLPPRYLKKYSQRLGVPISGYIGGDKFGSLSKKRQAAYDPYITSKNIFGGREFNVKSGGFVPNFAGRVGIQKQRNALANSESGNIVVVHRIKPLIENGKVSFPPSTLPAGGAGGAMVHHLEGMSGPSSHFPFANFLRLAKEREMDPRFFARNNFEWYYPDTDRKKKGLSSGFIPNFSNALNDAITREKSSGLSSSQIYTDTHPSLKNKNNPMGLMVANTRDEPLGGFQGINRAKKEGRNPSTYGGGMSSGFIPNFAIFGPGAEDVSALKELNDALKAISEKIKDAADNFSVADTENKVKKIEAEKARLETVAPKLTSTEILKSKSDVVTAEQLKSQAQKSGNKADIDAADKLLAEERKKLAKQEAALNTKIQARVKSLDDQIKAAKDSVTAHKSEQRALNDEVAQLRSRIKSKQTDMSLLGGGVGGFVKGRGRAAGYLKNNAMSIGFGGQALAGSIGEAVGGTETRAGRITSASASGLGDIVGMAGTGAMLGGGPGAAIGAVVGSAMAFVKIIDAINTKIPELEKALEKSSDNLNRFSESGQKLLQLNEQYGDALRSGNPAQSADIMVRVQKQYAEELSKLTEVQRASMISAVAQGKGQEAYAKILEELAAEKGADEKVTGLRKFKEAEEWADWNPVAGDNTKMLKGMDQSLASDFTKNLDVSVISDALANLPVANSLDRNDNENRALALMKSLADSSSGQQKVNLQKIIDGFADAASETDMNAISLAIVKAIQDKPKQAEDVKKTMEAAKAEQEIIAAKARREIAIREATNARLLKIQAETEDVYRRFNDQLDNLTSSMKTAITMRENSGKYKAEYLEQSGANSDIVDRQKEKNILQGSSDSLQLGLLENAQKSFQDSNDAVDQMLSTINTDSAKIRLGQSATDQGNEMNDIKLSLQAALAPVSAKMFEGKYDEAAISAEKIINELPQNAKSQIDEGVLVKGIQDLKDVARQGNTDQKKLIDNSRRDLGIQAQQLVFQKAVSKLTKAQNYGGSGINDIIRDEEDSAFGRASDSLTELKILGYSQKGLKRGSEEAVSDAPKGKEGETYGINGKTPSQSAVDSLANFYKAAMEIGGESVLSTDSKDFEVLTQTISEQINKRMEELRVAGDGVVDPAVFTRMQSTLETLGGTDQVSKLKVMKELGYANISGKKIMDEAMGGYSGGAFKGLDPSLQKAYSSTNDENTAATFILIAGQEKQTNMISDGLSSVTSTGLQTNSLLAQQPAAIADALAAVLEKGRAETSKDDAENKKSEADLKVLGSMGAVGDIKKTIEQNNDDIKTASKKNSELNPANIPLQQLQDVDQLAKMKELTKISTPAVLNGRFTTQEDKEKYKYAADFVKAAGNLGQIKDNNDNIEVKTKENKDLKSKQEGEERNLTVLQEDAKKKEQLVNEKALAVAEKSSAAESAKRNILPYDSSAGDTFVEKSAQRRNFYDNLGIDGESPNQRQALALQKSSPDYKKTSADGVKRTIEADAMYQTGTSPVNQGSLSKDNRISQLNKAFQLIDGQNALPSFENFKDIYALQGGGQEYAQEIFNKKRAEKFGLTEDSQANVTQRGAGINSPQLGTTIAGAAGGSLQTTGDKPRATEFLQTKYGTVGTVASNKDKLAAGIQRADEAQATKGFFAERDAAIETMKPEPPKYSRGTTVLGKDNKWETVTRPDANNPDDIAKYRAYNLQMGEYKTAKQNALYENSAFARKQSAAENMGAKPLGASVSYTPPSQPSTAIISTQDIESQDMKVNRREIATPGGPVRSAVAPSPKLDKGIVDAQEQAFKKAIETAKPPASSTGDKPRATEFLQTKYGTVGTVASNKDKLAAGIQRADEAQATKGFFAERDAAIETMKPEPPKYSRGTTVLGKDNKWETVTRPDANNPDDIAKYRAYNLQMGEYKTAKQNALYENSAFARKQSAAENMGVKPIEKQQQKVSEPEKKSPEQENANQLISSILTAVQGLSETLKQPPATYSQGGAAGSSEESAVGNSTINVSTPVSFSVDASGGQQIDQSKAVAEQIKNQLVSFLSSSEFTQKVKSIADAAAGIKNPPKQLPK